MATPYTYHTVQVPSEGVYTDKGSKFIGYAYPMSDEKEMKNILAELRRQHTGARHFCYAYRIGTSPAIERSSDDGEPSGTAGKPILNQLLSYGITDVGLVVVRYFGGTLLGSTGLIQAYKGAAKAALEAASIIEKEITVQENLTVPYSVYNDFMNLAKKYEVKVAILHTHEAGSDFSIEVPLRLNLQWIDEMNKLLSA